MLYKYWLRTYFCNELKNQPYSEKQSYRAPQDWIKNVLSKY